MQLPSSGDVSGGTRVYSTILRRRSSRLIFLVFFALSVIFIYLAATRCMPNTSTGSQWNTSALADPLDTDYLSPFRSLNNLFPVYFWTICPVFFRTSTSVVSTFPTLSTRVRCIESGNSQSPTSQYEVKHEWSTQQYRTLIALPSSSATKTRMDSNSYDHAENGRHADGPSPKKPKPSLLPITAEEIRSEFAHHDPAIARINNGSFGSCPSSVLAARSQWQHLFIRQPDHFYFNVLQPSLLRSRLLVKDLINADDVEEVSLVDNATTAAAIVLQQISWAFSQGSFSKGDAVVMLHYAYGSIKKSIHAYVSRAGGHVIEVPLPFPVSSDDEIINEFRKALEFGKSNGRRVRLAVIDHITSMPSVTIPVKELTRICREGGVDQVFIDAAHAIGNVEVDVKDIGADFYTSNLHKWFFCPPAVAFLYSRKCPASANLHHPVVSDRYGGGLPLESGWIGTRDYSAQLVVPSAVEFINRFEGGIAEIRKTNHAKVVEMGEMLSEAWGTFLGSPPEVCCSMVMVGIPGCLGVSSTDDALTLRSYLRNKFQVEVPIYYNPPKNFEGNGKGSGSLITGYARISHQVYNIAEDYYKLRDAVNKLVHNGFTCRMLSSS